MTSGRRGVRLAWRAAARVAGSSPTRTRGFTMSSRTTSVFATTKIATDGLT